FSSLSSSTESLVMAAVIVCPPISMRTCAVVVPFFTSTILPLSWLRALSFMGGPFLPSLSRCKAVARQDLLTLRGHDEVCKLLRRGRRTRYDGQSVVGSNGQIVRQRHDLLAGIFFLCRQRIRAIGQENVGPCFRDVPAIDRAPGRRRGAVRGTGQLQGFFLQRRLRAGPDRFGLAEDREGIVAGRIGLRRRGAELDARIEHALEQVGAVDLQPGPDQRAQR